MRKPTVDGEKVKGRLMRAMWLFLALLFLVTGVLVGIYSFWQGTHQNNDQNSAQSQGPTCTNDPSVVFNGAGAGGAPLAGQQLANFTPTASVQSLSCIDVKTGSGNQTVQSTSTITANYTGALAATGKIFQSSLDNNGQPFSTQLTGVIPGWQEGLIGMRAGGERRLIIPSVLAYGPQGSCETPNPKDTTKCEKYSIPPNANLVFDVTVLAIQ